MSARTLPLLFLNLGGEMLYILDQRLRAQSIPGEKARKDEWTDVDRKRGFGQVNSRDDRRHSHLPAAFPTCAGGHNWQNDPKGAAAHASAKLILAGGILRVGLSPRELQGSSRGVNTFPSGICPVTGAFSAKE